MTICSELNCSSVTVAKGLCSKHYKRYQRHGTTENTRPKDWGSREKHPLYQTWHWFKRYDKLANDLMDFWVFVETVGERPTDSRLKRKDDSEPLSKKNWYWKKHVNPYHSRKEKAAHMREYRKLNPERFRAIDLKRNHGITLEDYDEMLKFQNGVCAICGEKDPNYDNLAVDHCHETGKIRGLLCHHCNKSLGGFKDNPKLLSKAISYLEGAS